MSRRRSLSHFRNLGSALAASFFLLSLLLPARIQGQEPSPGEEGGAWKYKHLVVVVQNSGAHRPAALDFIQILNRLTEMKPPAVPVSLFVFEERFQQLEAGRFARKVQRLLHETSSVPAVREAVAELAFHGPSPIYDAVDAALEAAAQHSDAAILLLSNGIDNASAGSFKDLARRAKQAAVPILAFYFPTDPPQKGESHMRRLAKDSGGRFIDVRQADSWEQLLAALR